MPQFDTFSFLSQLFWLFFLFTLLYLSFGYYLLPSIAMILKVRNRKSSRSGLGDCLATDVSLNPSRSKRFVDLSSLFVNNSRSLTQDATLAIKFAESCTDWFNIFAVAAAWKGGLSCLVTCIFVTAVSA